MSETKAATPEKKKCNKGLWGLLGFIACAGGTIGGVLGGTLDKGRWIEGNWVSDYGTYVTVTATHWYAVSPWGTTVYTIDSKTDSITIMQNPADAAYNPSKWTKNEYHPVGDAGGWGVCSSVYDGDSAKAALEKDTTAVYSSTDQKTGCNKFPHTVMTKFEFPIAGKYKDNYGTELTITSTTWTSGSDPKSVYTIEAFGKNFILMQNPADAKYNPGLWTKVEFHTVGNGFGYCMSVYDGKTAAAAVSTDTSTVYKNDDAAAGCNGFPHSIASPA